MVKQYIFRALDNLKKPCITGVILEDNKEIIYDTKIHIPKKYFKEKGTYEVIPINGGLHPTNFQLYNEASFDIGCEIFAGVDGEPIYLNKHDRIQLFDNVVARKSHSEPAPILDKEARELLIIDNFIVKDEGEIAEAAIIKPATDNVLKTKPTDMRELGRKIIPVLRSS